MRKLIVGLALGTLLVAVGAAAAAGPATTTYHGVFTGFVTYDTCVGVQPAATEASGIWSVALHGDTDATVAVNIFTNGKHHVAFGTQFPQDAVLPDGWTLGPIETGAGPLRLGLVGDEFSYVIAPYNAFGIQCASVTYHGTLVSH